MKRNNVFLSGKKNLMHYQWLLGSCKGLPFNDYINTWIQTISHYVRDDINTKLS